MLRRVLFGVITIAFISLLFGISAGISYNFLNNSSFYVEHNFAEEREKKPKTYEFNIFMVGDALIHSSIYQDARQSDGSYDFRSMLE